MGENNQGVVIITIASFWLEIWTWKVKAKQSSWWVHGFSSENTLSLAQSGLCSYFLLGIRHNFLMQRNADCKSPLCRRRDKGDKVLSSVQQSKCLPYMLSSCTVSLQGDRGTRRRMRELRLGEAPARARDVELHLVSASHMTLAKSYVKFLTHKMGVLITSTGFL